MVSSKKSPKKSGISSLEIDEQELQESKETNVWLAVNTIFTVISGVAMIILTILAFWK